MEELAPAAALGSLEASAPPRRLSLPVSGLGQTRLRDDVSAVEVARIVAVVVGACAAASGGAAAPPNAAGRVAGSVDVEHAEHGGNQDAGDAGHVRHEVHAQHADNLPAATHAEPTAAR